jgi:AraC-like DNA-binding protein
MATVARQHPQHELTSLSSGRRRSSRSTMAARRIRSPRTFTHAHRQGLDRVIEHYVRDCFQRETRATVGELAAILGRHPDYLTRTAGAILGGASLLDYLRRKQLEEAERLITVTTLPMKEIALRAGFGTVSTFYRHFREAHGMSPGAFRKVRK